MRCAGQLGCVLPLEARFEDLVHHVVQDGSLLGKALSSSVDGWLRPSRKGKGRDRDVFFLRDWDPSEDQNLEGIQNIREYCNFRTASLPCCAARA